MRNYKFFGIFFIWEWCCIRFCVFWEYVDDCDVVLGQNYCDNDFKDY